MDSLDPATRLIRVWYLHPNANKETLEAYFSQFGRVLSAAVDNGFGYVQFQDRQAAQRAKAHPEHMINGRYAVIEWRPPVVRGGFGRSKPTQPKTVAPPPRPVQVDKPAAATSGWSRMPPTAGKKQSTDRKPLLVTPPPAKRIRIDSLDSQAAPVAVITGSTVAKDYAHNPSQKELSDAHQQFKDQLALKDIEHNRAVAAHHLEMTKLETKYSALERKLDENIKCLEKESGRADQLENKYQKQTNLVENLKAELKRRSLAYGKIRTELDDLKIKNQELGKTVASLRDDLATAQSGEKWANATRDLEALLLELKNDSVPSANIDTVTKDRDEWTTRTEATEAKIVILEKELEEKKNDVSSRQAEVNAGMIIRNELKLRAKESEAKVVALENEIEKKKTAQAELENRCNELKSRIDDAVTKLSRVGTDVETAKKERDTWKAKATSLENRVQNLNQEVDELVLDRNGLKTLCAHQAGKVREKDDELASIRKDLKSKAQNEEVTAVVNSLKAQIDQMKKDAEIRQAEVDAGMKNRDELNARAEESEAKVIALAKELEEKKASQAEIERRCNELETKIDRANADRNQLEAEVKTAKQERDAWKAKAENAGRLELEWVERYERLVESLHKAEQASTGLRSEIDTVTEERDKWKMNAVSLENMVKDLHREVEAAEKDRNEIKAINRHMAENLKAALDATAEWTRKTEESDTTLGVLRLNVEQLEIAKAQLEERCQKQMESIDSLERRLQEKDEAMKTVQESLKSMEMERVKAEEKAQKAFSDAAVTARNEQDRIGKYKSALAKKEKELAEKNKANDNLSRDLHGQRKQCEELEKEWAMIDRKNVELRYQITDLNLELKDLRSYQSAVAQKLERVIEMRRVYVRLKQLYNGAAKSDLDATLAAMSPRIRDLLAKFQAAVDKLFDPVDSA